MVRGSMLLTLVATVGLLVCGAGVHDSASAATRAPTTTIAAASDDSTAQTSSSNITAGTLRKVDTVELDAETITLLRNGQPVATSSLRSGDRTVHLLTRLLGTPKHTQTTEGDGTSCFPTSTSYAWGDSLRLVLLADRAASGNDLTVRLLGASVEGRAGRTVLLEGPNGVSVGDNIAAEIAKAPSADKNKLGASNSPAWQLLLEPGWDTADKDGVSVLTNGTVSTVIGSPMPLTTTSRC